MKAIFVLVVWGLINNHLLAQFNQSYGPDICLRKSAPPAENNGLTLYLIVILLAGTSRFLMSVFGNPDVDEPIWRSTY